jgi:hypothetical protein
VICAYLDDAGNTGQRLDDLDQPLHYVGALLVPESKWAYIKTALKSAESIARERGYREDSLEFHGKEVYQGEKGWSSLSFADRLIVYESCISAFDTEGVSLCYGICDKQKLNRYAKPAHPHSVALWLCLERIALFAKTRDSLALLIADDCSHEMKRVSHQCLNQYREQGSPFGVTVDLHRLSTQFTSCVPASRRISSFATWHYTFCVGIDKRGTPVFCACGTVL